MAVIAFPTFVVVAHHALAIFNVGQPVLLVMLAWRQSFHELPDDDFDDGAVGADFLAANEGMGFHVLRGNINLPANINSTHLFSLLRSTPQKGQKPDLCLTRPR